MAIKQRIEKLEEQPEYRPPEILLVTPLKDGTFREGEKIYTREQLDELGASGTRVVIWRPHRPEYDDPKAVG